MPSIGLYVIVKNEAESLPALLRSIQGGFDQVVLCDTGSTDATIVIFEDWAVEHHVDYKVAHFNWCDDFGAARQYALEQLDTDWCVWADADDTVEGIELLPALLASVDDHVTGILMPYAWTPTFTGHHLRATRRGAATWNGRLHEAMTVNGVRGVISQVTWKTNRPGGNRPFEEDLRILQADLAENPTNARSQFYLAQTYKDMGRIAEAIAAYDDRVRMGGWVEEVYYAAYMGGVLSHDLNLTSDWVPRLLAAHQLRPQRVEALHELARRLRMTGLYWPALLFANAAIEVPPPGDILFVHKWMHDWGAEFEASICEYYCGQPHRCALMSRNLLKRWADEMPEGVVEALLKNIDLADALANAPAPA